MSEKEKDLGVDINNRLSSENYVKKKKKKKVSNMYNLLANMRVAFTYVDEKW